MKICSICKKEKELEAFYKKSSNSDGLNCRCKECVNLQLKHRYASNQNHRINSKNRSLRRKYGISIEEYEFLAKAQNYRCKSCGEQETSPNSHKTGICALAVDHDHKTNQKRGLLCGKCNKALGLLDDSPKKIQALLEYLSKYN